MNNAGTIKIDRLRIFARHGVARQEQMVGNDFEVTLEVTVDMARALEHDDLAGTVNYADLVAVIKREMAVPSQLLENVVFRIFKSVTSRFDTLSGRVTLSKLTPPIAGCDAAGVSVTYNW